MLARRVLSGAASCLLATLFSMLAVSPARASLEHADLVLEACDAHTWTRTLLSALRVELAAEGLDVRHLITTRRDADTSLVVTVNLPVCDAEASQVIVRVETGGDAVARTLDLADVALEHRARTLALAIGEALRSSRDDAQLDAPEVAPDPPLASEPIEETSESMEETPESIEETPAERVEAPTEPSAEAPAETAPIDDDPFSLGSPVATDPVPPPEIVATDDTRRRFVDASATMIAMPLAPLVAFGGSLALTSRQLGVGRIVARTGFAAGAIHAREAPIVARVLRLRLAYDFDWSKGRLSFGAGPSIDASIGMLEGRPEVSGIAGEKGRLGLLSLGGELFFRVRVSPAVSVVLDGHAGYLITEVRARVGTGTVATIGGVSLALGVGAGFSF